MGKTLCEGLFQWGPCPHGLHILEDHGGPTLVTLYPVCPLVSSTDSTSGLPRGYHVQFSCKPLCGAEEEVQVRGSFGVRELSGWGGNRL